MSDKYLGLDLRLPINVNLYWGVLLLIFGALMLALGWRAQRGGRT